MKRQEKYPDTKWFHYHNENPKNRVTTGDCTYRAIAKATGVDWRSTLKRMTLYACESGYCPNDKLGINGYLKSNGWVMCKQPKNPDGTRMTGKEFCEHLKKIKCIGNVIVHIGSKHLTCFVKEDNNYRVYDTWDCTKWRVGNYWIKVK